jgi:hypothetical protein
MDARATLTEYGHVMALETFEDDDASYERWLEQHPDGYVLNSRRSPTRSYLKLHRATCHHIRVLHPGYSRWTTGAYIKICADGRDELADWAAARVGGELESGCYCLQE